MAALGLALSSICQTPTLAANAIDTLYAQMSQAAANARDDEGLAIAQKLEVLVKRQQGANSMGYAGTLHNEGMFLNNLGRYKDAADKLNASLAIKLRNNDAASIIGTSNLLVNSLMMLERRGEALAVAKQSLAIGTQAFGADDPRLADALEAMGLIEREQENYRVGRRFFPALARHQAKGAGRDASRTRACDRLSRRPLRSGRPLRRWRETAASGPEGARAGIPC